MINYSLYPTLLDTFYWYKIKGNIDELLNKINRVKTPMAEAALKGVAFETAVNDALDGVKTIDHYFDQDLINRVASKLQNHTKKQEFIQRVIPTGIGNVKLYGFVDYTYPDKYIDLKTTGKYSDGKFKNNNQHGCYSLISPHINEFHYLVTDFSKLYIESYVPDKAIKDQTIFNITEFCEWLEANRDKITDTKIFGN